MTIDQRMFRDALGFFATGIAVVTTTDGTGAPIGLTVNSFTSVSLDPPLVLFCIDRGTQCLEAFAQTGRFAVNILEEGQRAISARFASPVADRFDRVEYTPGLGGCPLLAGCLSTLECELRAVHDGGDHVILVGEVVRLAHAGGGRPLLYFRGAYAELGPATA
ncbi:MAG TPA: flavin reductase family protein [Azospirillaceae bacterium]|nr:flavin reductase family protein [Azospirillaceae bacterium]